MSYMEGINLSSEAIEKLGRFERAEILMAKDLKENSFERLLELLQKASTHALLIKYRGTDSDAVLVEGALFDSMAETLRTYKRRIEELEDLYEEKEIEAEMTSRIVTEQTDWKPANEFFAALQANQPKVEG